MIGRVYINELNPGAVVMDFSSWPSHILNDNEPYGYAYSRTIEQLGITRQDVSSRTIILSGETSRIRAGGEWLARQIGGIASSSAEKSNNSFMREAERDHVERMLGHLTQETLVGMPDDMPFRDAAEAVTKPFAEAASDPKELFDMGLQGTPWWFDTEYEIGRRTQAEAAERQTAIDAFLATGEPR